MNSSVVRKTQYAIRNTRYAFTLIEILVSITIVSLVGMAVYSIFANGINAWRRGNENSNYERNVRLISEKFARELRNTSEFSNIAFEGTKDSIMFPALILSESISDNGETESYYEVGRLAFFYDKTENALCKEEKTFPEAFSQEEIGEGKVLIEDVRKLEFSYCYLDNATGKYKWKEDWKKEEQESIPQAVKIEMVLGANEDDFEKTIFIPIGTGEQKKDAGSKIKEIK